MKTKTVTVRVTKYDIANGVAGDCASCPVARALLRALKGKGEVVTMPDRVRWTNYPHATMYGTPPREVYDFIVSFDRHRVVKAFNFQLTLRVAPPTLPAT